MSKGLKILLIVFVVVSIVCGITYFTVDDVEESQNEVTEENESIIPKGLSITKENTTLESGNISINFMVENKKSKNIYLKSVNVIVKDKKGNVISDLKLPIDKIIKKDEEIQLMAQDSVNYSGKIDKTIYKFETE